MVLLDENLEECEGEKPITEYTSSAKTLTLDYKDHVVFQFTTLGEGDKPELKFKFIPYDCNLTKDKVKLKKKEEV